MNALHRRIRPDHQQRQQGKSQRQPAIRRPAHPPIHAQPDPDRHGDRRHRDRAVELGDLVRERTQPEPVAERLPRHLDQNAQAPQDERRHHRRRQQSAPRHLGQPTEIHRRRQARHRAIQPLQAWQALHRQQERQARERQRRRRAVAQHDAEHRQDDRRVIQGTRVGPGPARGQPLACLTHTPPQQPLHDRRHPQHERHPRVVVPRAEQDDVGRDREVQHGRVRQLGPPPGPRDQDRDDRVHRQRDHPEVVGLAGHQPRLERQAPAPPPSARSSRASRETCRTPTPRGAVPGCPTSTAPSPLRPARPPSIRRPGRSLRAAGSSTPGPACPPRTGRCRCGRGAPRAPGGSPPA